jgi:o-succinylbenzoate synthase
MQASFKKYTLKFKQASGTSRGILKTKETYFLIIEENDKKGVGECGLFRGLSVDDRLDYEDKLHWTCKNIQLDKGTLLKELREFPSIQFGLEQAFLSLKSNNPFELFPSNFTKGQEAIKINGLVWMGDAAFMRKQIIEKLESGFTTIKLKIGAIDFETELSLLKSIRNEFSSNEIELRVDANGAFNTDEALEKLKQLSEYNLQSIEQPIKAGQWYEMAELCLRTPLPIALDEELIGIINYTDKEKLIETIKPQYIILKPSLIGGFGGSEEWIKIANTYNVGWWITSALESNIGLNAIAQFTYSLSTKMPQGLGTGGLFTNNFDSPLFVKKGYLNYNPQLNWNFKL